MNADTRRVVDATGVPGTDFPELRAIVIRLMAAAAPDEGRRRPKLTLIEEDAMPGQPDWLIELEQLADELAEEYLAPDDEPPRPSLTVIQGGRDG